MKYEMIEKMDAHYVKQLIKRTLKTLNFNLKIKFLNK